MKINPNKNYTPKEAAELVMTANTKDTRQQMMWRHIRNGTINAIDIEDGERSRYIIKGHELVRYKNR